MIIVTYDKRVLLTLVTDWELLYPEVLTRVATLRNLRATAGIRLIITSYYRNRALILKYSRFIYIIYETSLIVILKRRDIVSLRKKPLNELSEKAAIRT